MFAGALGCCFARALASGFVVMLGKGEGYDVFRIFGLGLRKSHKTSVYAHQRSSLSQNGIFTSVPRVRLERFHRQKVIICILKQSTSDKNLLRGLESSPCVVI